MSRSTLRRRKRDERILQVLGAAEGSHHIHAFTPISRQDVHPRDSSGANRASDSEAHPNERAEDHAEPMLSGGELLDDNTLKAALDLQFIWEEYSTLSSSFLPQPHQLVFIEDPKASRTSRRRPSPPAPSLHSTPLPLVSEHKDNQQFLAHEAYLFRTLCELKQHTPPMRPAPQRLHAQLVDALQGDIERLNMVKRDEWNRRREVQLRDDESFVDTEHLFRPVVYTKCPGDAVVRACKLIASLMHLTYGLAQRPTRLLLAAFRTIVRLTMAYMRSTSPELYVHPTPGFGSNPMFHPPTTTAAPISAPVKPVSRDAPHRPSSISLLSPIHHQNSPESIVESIPKDIQSIFSDLRLDPSIHPFVCCPTCFALYRNQGCPDVCTFRATPGSAACQSKLWRTREIRGRAHRKPVLEYHHQSMKSWVGKFLARPGIEDLLDTAHVPSTPPSVARDFWDGLAIRDFAGPAGSPTSYMDTSDAPKGTARLVFGLAIDGFNPYRANTVKLSVTSTAIYMVCLNLPPHLRTLPENMYLVGVIPGKPSKDQINHFLGLLVDDLLPFWEGGMYFSRTAKFDQGRLVNAAMIPLIADLGAARQVSGLASANMTYFCSCCYLEVDFMENFDPSSWPHRDPAQHRRAAEAWKNAPTMALREELFKEWGVRWTELMRLPYWHPLSHTLIDSMHNWYLGLFETHCRDNWGMSIKLQDGDGLANHKATVPARPSGIIMDIATHYLLHGTSQQLQSHATKAVLWHLCAEHGLRRAGTVAKLLAELLTWRTMHGLPVETSRPVPHSKPPSQRKRASDAHQNPDSHPSSGTIPPPGADRTRSAGHPVFSAPEGVSDKDKHNFEKGERLLVHGFPAKSLIAAGKTALGYMCQIRGLDGGGTRMALAERLIAWANARDPSSSREVPPAQAQPQATADEPHTTLRSDFTQGSEPIPAQPNTVQLGQASSTTRSVVLGKETLSLIHEDAGKTQLPSWVNRAPNGFGSAGRGKLSADQWRTLCTIHLPITLIRLWHDAEHRQRAMLQNFMHLVTAVGIAGLLQISERDIALYTMHLLAYLNGMKALYPEATVKPNHHMAIHIARYLREFGPVHSWRAYAFIRKNRSENWQSDENIVRDCQY